MVNLRVAAVVKPKDAAGLALELVWMSVKTLALRFGSAKNKYNGTRVWRTTISSGLADQGCPSGIKSANFPSSDGTSALAAACRKLLALM